MDIKNQIALITGGGSGLGAATARYLAQLGAQVVILDMQESAHTVAKECNGRAFIVDVANATAVDDVLKNLETPRIVVNCAGIAPGKKIVSKNGVMPLEDFQHVIQVNLIGTFNVLRLVAARMSALDPIDATGERGIIINTASIAAYEGQIGQTAYAASKAGIVGLTLPAARELAPLGIRVMTIAPGLMATPMLSGMREDVQEALQKNLLFPARLGEPHEYAELVAHIIANPMLNGSVIRLDGALHLPPS
jgi:NAD(P)-dependent dehydrogenase (short-subunit alcohol dehydrogenase family)